VTAYATDALLLRARNLENPDPIVLVRIDLSVPSAKTVRVSSRQTNAGGVDVWQPQITNLEPVSATAVALDGGPNYATFGFTLENGKLNYQASGTATLPDSLIEFEWQGALVTAYRYFEGLSSTDPQQIFSGEIIAIYGDERETRFKCRQIAVDASVPDLQITKATHPAAPPSSLEKWAPVLIGSKAAPP